MWTWEQWQWRGTMHSPKLQHYWSLTIILVSVVSRTLIGGGVLPLCREAVGVFYSPSVLGNVLLIYIIFHLFTLLILVKCQLWANKFWHRIQQNIQNGRRQENLHLKYLAGWSIDVSWYINICGLINAKSCLYGLLAISLLATKSFKRFRVHLFAHN